MLKIHASILSEISIDPFTPDHSDFEEAVMPCMEIVDSDDESDDDIDVMENVNFTFCWFVNRCTNMRKNALLFSK